MTTHTKYMTIDILVANIAEPNLTPCLALLNDYRELFETTYGSTHNHQTWPGGYIDHVTDCLNYACLLFAALEQTGRPLPFTLSDALLILFLHDLEKPFRILVNAEGQASNKPGLDTKQAYEDFRLQKLAEYHIKLTPAQQNGLKYVEGEYKDYSSQHRVMNELAAFCHMVDTWSARGAYDYPQAENDPWHGAKQFRKMR